MEKSSKRKFHYAWLVMIACGLMTSGSLGFFTVVAGNFYVPVSVDLGIEESALTLYMTIASLGMAVAMPMAGRIIPKVNMPVFITVLSAIEVVAVALMSTYTETWMWYASGAVIGFCMGFNTTVCLSMVLNNWFFKKTGFAIGTCWAISSLSIAIMSPVISTVIHDIGWRSAYIVLAVVSACIMLPSTAFIIRLKPEDKGMLPYGYDEASTAQEEVAGEGVPFNKATKSLAFIALVGAMCLIVLTTVTNQLFPMYGHSVGFDPAIGSLMISVAMLCDIAWNPLIGVTCDKMGPARAVVMWSGVTVLSFVVLMLSENSPILAFIGAGLNDSMYAVFGTGIATLTIVLFGKKHYGRIYSMVPAIGYVIGSAGAPLLSSIYMETGSFQPVWMFCIVCDIIIATLVVVAMKAGKKLPWEKANGTPIKNPSAVAVGEVSGDLQE